MTHGGIEQLSRQLGGEGNLIQSNFSKNDIENLIIDINAYMAIFLIDYNEYQTDDELKVLANEMLNIKKE